MHSHEQLHAYIPFKKAAVGWDTILYLLFGLCIVPPFFEIYILNHDNDEISTLSRILLYCETFILLLAFIAGLISNNRHKPLRGRLTGQLRFENDSINVNGREYLLQDISKISFSLTDYYGQYTGGRFAINGKRSQGVNNSVTLYFPDGEKTVFYFQVPAKHGIRAIKEQLISYHLSGKLHFLQLTDALGITRYEDIQEFKKIIYR